MPTHTKGADILYCKLHIMKKLYERNARRNFDPKCTINYVWRLNYE